MKPIETIEQAPWIQYIEIDSKTHKRKLRKDTPKEIKKAYELHLKEIKKCQEQNNPIAK